MSPKADVYAGDLGLFAEKSRTGTDYRFHITAEASPDVLLRIAVPLNIANIAPRAASLRTRADGQIEFAVVIPGIPASMAESIGRKLDQLLIVTHVQMEPCPADAE